jgi:Kef-type K+ transport system membrane component KefB
MISRGEVGLIVAGIATAAYVVSPSTYSTIVLMVVVTTIIPPILLKKIAGKVSIKDLPTNNRQR